MKKVLFLGLCMVFSLVSMAQELKVNAENAKISFDFVKENTKGTLKGLKASIKFDAANPGSAVISGSVDVNTISTGNKMRDKHLKSDEYFDVAKFSKISFKSTSVAKNGDSYVMKGKMKIKGVEKDVSFNFTYSNKTFKGTATVYSSDFGIAMKKKRELNQVNISIEIPVL